MAASTYFAQVQQLYIAYFGRPADPTGQAYWAANIDAAKGDISAVIAGFSASKESQELFGNKSTIDKVNAIYQNAFGRAPEPAGLAYWVEMLDSGKVSQAQASWTIQQNAGPGDAAAVQNKLTAAQAFTAQIDTTAEINGYQGANAAQVARDFLSGVTADNATATAAVAGAAAALAEAVAVGGVVGNTYVLTGAIDVLTGTANNDLFIGDLSTIQVADQINGGAGVDTFEYFGATGTPALPTLTNVERLVLTNADGVTVTAQNIKDLTDVVLKGATGTNELTVGTGVKITVDGGDAAQVATVNFADTAAAASVALTNGATVATLTANGAALKTLNIASSGSAANTIGTLTNATVNALNISGVQKLEITNALSANFTTVDASANTGGVALTFGTADVTVTGGAGNDRFNFGTTLTAADKVDGGAGIDTIVVGDAAATTVAGLNASKNIEVAEFNGAGPITLALGTAAGSLNNASITKLFFNTTDNDIVNNADAAHTFAFAKTGDATLNLANGVTTANVSLEGQTAGTLAVNLSAADLLANPALVSTVNIASTVGANTLTALTAQAGSKFNVTGDQDLTITALTNSAKVDASALTGVLTITGSAGADTIILGSAADVVNVQAAGSTYGAMDIVTNFTKADTLNLTGFTGTDFVKFDASNVNSFEQAVVGAEQAAGATAGNAAYFTYQNNTYVVVNIDTAVSANTTDSTDLVIKLSGVMDLVADGTAIHAAA